MARAGIERLRVSVTPQTLPAYHAHRLLHFGYAVVPIIAGVDKFFNLLADWSRYLWPPLAGVVHTPPGVFMRGAGLVEILAGLLVAFTPRVGAYVVAVWLWAIIANLLLIPGYYDIALRDAGLSIGALALGRLSQQFDAGSATALASPVPGALRDAETERPAS